MTETVLSFWLTEYTVWVASLAASPDGFAPTATDGGAPGSIDPNEPDSGARRSMPLAGGEPA